MILQGRSISPGVAQGRADVIHPRAMLAAALTIPPQGSAAAERERLLSAIARACAQLNRMKHQLDRQLARQDVAIFDTHAGILRDPKFIEQIEREILDHHQSAEAAVARVVNQAYITFAASKIPLVHDKAADLLDIGQRLLQCLTATAASQATPAFLSGEIVVATALTPSEFVHLAHQRVAGIVTESCGTKSHTAILARGMGIPFVSGIHRVAELISPQAELLIDATAGIVLVDPPSDDPSAVSIRQQLVNVTAEVPLARQIPVTLDGARISLLLNISDVVEADAIGKLGADGIGLFRTEFLYMDRSGWPTEQQCYDDYHQVCQVVGDDAELNIRLADFGAEKCPSYSDIPSFRNPSLGLRGMRLLLEREDILRPQLRALAEIARRRPITLLLPMLDTVDTLDTIVDCLQRILGLAGRERFPFRLGAMIECPSAALMIDELLARVDAVSVGLNDLTQYLLAVDRDDESVERYHDAMQPPVLRLLARVVAAADSRDKPVTICGELAGDANLTGLLLALGIRRFSVSQSSYRAVLRSIRQLRLEQLQPLGAELLELPTGRQVHQFVATHLTPALQPASPSLS
jgi:phosphoenolpyruvate-protein phosphotransferase